jgi:hypothetical protein
LDRCPPKKFSGLHQPLFRVPGTCVFSGLDSFSE